MLPPDVGHRKPFANACSAIGLQAPWTATTPTDAFWTWARPILDAAGPYPHDHLRSDLLGARKKQKTYMLKCECVTCGYAARTTQKFIDQAGPPICPACREPLAIAGAETSDDA